MNKTIFSMNMSYVTNQQIFDPRFIYYLICRLPYINTVSLKYPIITYSYEYQTNVNMNHLFSMIANVAINISITMGHLYTTYLFWIHNMMKDHHCQIIWSPNKYATGQNFGVKDEYTLHLSIALQMTSKVSQNGYIYDFPKILETLIKIKRHSITGKHIALLIQTIPITLPSCIPSVLSNMLEISNTFQINGILAKFYGTNVRRRNLAIKHRNGSILYKCYINNPAPNHELYSKYSKLPQFRVRPHSALTEADSRIMNTKYKNQSQIRVRHHSPMADADSRIIMKHVINVGMANIFIRTYQNPPIFGPKIIFISNTCLQYFLYALRGIAFLPKAIILHTYLKYHANTKESSDNSRAVVYK